MADQTLTSLDVFEALHSTPARRYLSKKDITVYAPLLPGHGSSPECLFSVNSDDWILEMEKSLHRNFLKVKQLVP